MVEMANRDGHGGCTLPCATAAASGPPGHTIPEDQTMTMYSFPITAHVSPNGVRREMDRLMNEVFGTVRPGAGALDSGPERDDETRTERGRRRWRF